MANTPDIGTGVTLAFISHFLLDYIGEESYGDLKITLIFEGVLFASFLLIAHFTGTLWISLLGWVAGNLPDIIDKQFYLNPNNKERYFSCHNGNGMFRFLDYKLGYPVALKLTRNQTYFSGILATILFLILT